MPLLGATGGGSAKGFGALANLGYYIKNSLRFRGSNSAYLNRTLTTPTNNKIWTWSAWVKRGTLTSSSQQHFFNYWTGSNGQSGVLFSANTDTIEFFDYTGSYGYQLVTTQVFRDPSAWYHFVIAVDTTQATSSNRIKMYINGTQVTAFSTSTYPSQNYNTLINSANAHYIGRRGDANGYFDGYMGEINFIDGQALTPSSFGKTDAVTGQWIPKKFAGTYGTNGFYLKFADASAATAAAIGKDSSPNGNNWTPNNISVTAGATYDAMTDSPTLSAAASNYCVLNPLIPITTTTIINGNLGLSSYNASGSVFGTIGVSSGKWYFESISQSDAMSGISGTINGGAFPGAPANAYTWDAKNAQKISNSSSASYGSAASNGDIIGVAFDLDSGSITFYKNNVSQGVAYTFTPSGTYFPVFRNGDPAGSPPGGNISVNFGQRPFAYTPPTGYKALNTFNLP